MIKTEQLSHIQHTPKDVAVDSAFNSILTQLIKAAYPHVDDAELRTLKKDIQKKRQWRYFISARVECINGDVKGVIALDFIDLPFDEMDHQFLVELANGEPEAITLARVESDLDLAFLSTMVVSRVYNSSADHIRSIGLKGLGQPGLASGNALDTSHFSDDPFHSMALRVRSVEIAMKLLLERVLEEDDDDDWSASGLPATDDFERVVVLKGVPPYLVEPWAFAAAENAMHATGVAVLVEPSEDLSTVRFVAPEMGDGV